MDPNVTWHRIRELIAMQELSTTRREELVWLLGVLADWLNKGGFLPCPFEAKEDA